MDFPTTPDELAPKEDWVKWALLVQHEIEGATAIPATELSKLWDAAYRQGRISGEMDWSTE